MTDTKRLSELAGPAIRAFTQIALAWHLTEDEQVKLLGLASPATLRTWRSQPCPHINAETLERISYILGIYMGINMLLPEERASDWMRAPNSAPVFGGASALECMTRGDISDLAAVRRYIDAQRV